MFLLLVCGKKGSGKAIFGEVAKELGLHTIEMSSVIYEEMKKRRIEINSKNVGRFAIWLREKFGKDIVARLIIKKLLGKNAVVIGVRSPEEIKFFRKNATTLLVEVRTEDKLRFERMLKRKHLADPTTFEEFTERERMENALGLEETIKMADVVIENNTTVKAFKEKVKRFLIFTKL